MSIDTQDPTHENIENLDNPDATMNSLAATFAAFPKSIDTAEISHSDRLGKLKQNLLKPQPTNFTNLGSGSIIEDSLSFGLPDLSLVATPNPELAIPEPVAVLDTLQPEFDSTFHFPNLDISTQPPLPTLETISTPAQPELNIFSSDPVLDTPLNFIPVAEALEISQNSELLENQQQSDKEQVNNFSEPVVMATLNTDLSPVIPDVQIEEVLTPTQIIKNNIVKFYSTKSPDLRAFEKVLNDTMSKVLANNN
jgi:hypothetical protein